MSNAIVLAFSTHLRKLREAKGMSQEDLATDAEVSRRTILRIEKGEHNPSLVMLMALSKALSISIQELVTFKVPE